MSVFILTLGAVMSIIMGVLDYTGTIAVPNWQNWIPFCIGLGIFLIVKGGGVIFEAIGDIFSAIAD